MDGGDCNYEPTGSLEETLVYDFPTLRRQPSISSIDSDATASDLPGPGRNLGRLYETLGDGLVSQIAKGRTRRGYGPGAVSRKVVTKQRSVSSDSIDTDATAPNLPGPGRTVGLFFDWLGGKLERQLGSLMERRGYGPEATMVKILAMRGRWRTYREGERVFIRNNAEIHGEEHRKLLRYCQRLLKYTRSLISQTQLQAFDRITDLATNDPYIRELLSECLDKQKQNKYLSPDDRSFVSSSQKALVSLSSNAITNVTQKYERSLKEGLLNERFVRERFLPVMTKYLSNPEASFLAVRSARYLNDINSYGIGTSFKDFDVTLMNTALNNPDVIEWSSFDTYISSQLSRDYLHAYIGPILLRRARVIPNIIAWYSRVLMTMFNEIHYRQPDFREGFSVVLSRAETMFTVLKACARTDDLDCHLAYFDAVNQEMQPLLRNTPFMSKPSIVLCHMLHKSGLYEWSGPLFSRRLPPPPRKVDSDIDGWLQRVLSSCRALVRFLESEEEEVRAQAVECTTIFALNDRYCKMAINIALKELPRTISIHDLGKPNYDIRRFHEAPSCFIRHSTEAGGLCVAGDRPMSAPALASAMCPTCSRPYEYFLLCHDDALVWLEHKEGQPFDSTDHLPVLAGTNANGQSEFIACVPDAHSGIDHFTTIKDGDIAVKYAASLRPKRTGDDDDDDDEKVIVEWLTSRKFYVLASRYDVEDLAHIYPPLHPRAVDPTGPFFWRKVLRYGRRVGVKSGLGKE